MTEHPLSLKTAYVTDTLDEVVDKFDKVSGLPVVDENGIVQGVITKKVGCYCCFIFYIYGFLLVYHHVCNLQLAVLEK